MKTQLRYALCFAAAAVCGSAWSTPPVPTPDDNGHEAFVQQVLPKLLGRKPRGSTEVNLLADIAQLHGREALVRSLMEGPEFTEHMTAMLVDALQVQRSISREVPAACLNAPTPAALGFATEPDPGALARFVRDNAVSAQRASPFNLNDLIGSSIALDSLYPMMRGYLFVLGSRLPGSSMSSEAERREIVGTDFDEVFLGRRMACMSCHRGTYSTTGVGQRTHPLYHSLELAVFDHLDLGEVDEIDNMDFQQSCGNAGCHGPDARGNGAATPGIRGWSAEQLDAVLRNPPPAMGGDWSWLYNDGQALAELSDALGGAFGAAQIGATATAHFAGFRTDLFEAQSAEDADPIGPWGFDTQCAHVLQGAAWQSEDDAPPGFFAGLHADDLSLLDIDDKLRAGYLALNSASLPNLAVWDEQSQIPGDLATAYMVAARLTDSLWQMLMGERLTIVNQFARNEQQMRMHKYLTEDVFIANDWSLRELVVEILGTRYFNRRPPADSTQVRPFAVEALFDPFDLVKDPCIQPPAPGDGDGLVVTDQLAGNTPPSGAGSHADFPVFPSLECSFNGQGHLVHRYRPRTLLSAVAAALAWPGPRIAPGNGYPSAAFSARIGQYRSNFDPGTDTVNFQALLEWDGEYGQCRHPTSSSQPDWIDWLVARIDAFNDSHPGPPILLADVVASLKDRLLQTPAIDGWPAPPLNLRSRFANAAQLVKPPSEADLLEALFGMPLDAPVSSATFEEDDSTLRQLCGVYLKTPQFMLSGLLRGTRHAPPRLRACGDAGDASAAKNVARSCSYRSMCESLSPALAAVGAPTNCMASSVGQVFDMLKLAPRSAALDPHAGSRR